MAKTFSAQVSEWVKKCDKRLLATFRESAQDVAEVITLPMEQGGKMRVKTGFLRSSLMASTASMPRINLGSRPPADAPRNSFDLDASTIEAVIIGAQITDTIFMGFTAGYARPREYKDAFVEGAALQWPQIVERNAVKAILAFP